MTIPEPPSSLGLWPKVRAISGWPETDEEAVRSMSAGYQSVQTVFADTDRVQPAAVVASWPDVSGQIFGRAISRQLTTTHQVATDLGTMVQRTAGFADEIAAVKTDLNALILMNLAPYATLSVLPAGVRAVAEERFVAQVAQFATQRMQEAAGRIGAGGPIPVTAKPDAKAPPGPPPKDGTPEQNAAYWNQLTEGLTEDEKLQLAREIPDFVGNADGIPVVYRSAANEAVLARNRAKVEADLADARNRLNAATEPGEAFAIAGQIEQLEKSLRGIDEIKSRLDATATADPSEKFYLIKLDPTGDGRAIVARGNPDTAVNVATFVPGSLTDLGSMHTLLDQGDAMHRAALHSGVNPVPTSVITWLDYDSPDSIPAAAWAAPAEEAAPRFNAFQEGLRVTHQGDPSHNTVVGHSYGSTVAGYASRVRPLPIDDFVAVGSPGVGVEHADQLGIRPGHVWVVESSKDPIADTGQFAADPSDTDFGARVIGQDATVPRSSSVWEYDTDSHDAYFRELPGNAGLRRIGDIITEGDIP